MSVALVTGGGGGIGRAIAVRLAADGYDVAVVDIDDKLGMETTHQVEAKGRRALFIRADVSKAEDVARYVAETEEKLGPIAAFANNAGLEGVLAPIDEYPDDVFDRLLSVNVKGVFLGLKHVLARMRTRGKGAVVNMASTSSIRGRPTAAGYVATKHAVLGLTRVACLDFADVGVRVNAVLPGPIETRMMESLDQQAQARGAPIKRAGNRAYGKADDVANVVAFLLSDQASHVNGAAWVVGAGTTVP